MTTTTTTTTSSFTTTATTQFSELVAQKNGESISTTTTTTTLPKTGATATTTTSPRNTGYRHASSSSSSSSSSKRKQLQQQGQQEYFYKEQQVVFGQNRNHTVVTKIGRTNDIKQQQQQEEEQVQQWDADRKQTSHHRDEQQQQHSFSSRHYKNDSSNSNSSRNRRLRRRDTDTATINTIVDDIMNQMSLEQLIGQMGQIDVNMLLTVDPNDNNNKKKHINVDAVNYHLGQKGIGSVLNTPNTDGIYWTKQQYRSLIQQFNIIVKDYGHATPIIYGIDSVHGANYIYDSILSPQPINIAATFNTTHSYSAGQIASYDSRHAGMNWLFSPLIGIVSHQSKWSRIYETFGEDPYLVGKMASAMIQGIQEPEKDIEIDPKDDTTTTNKKKKYSYSYPKLAAACAKHYIGYSNPQNGHDRSPSEISTRTLYQYYVPPWKRAIQGNMNNNNNNNDSNNDKTMFDYSKARTVMTSYTGIDGIPNTMNHDTVNYLLRYQLQFDGVIVTDYMEMLNLFYYHHVIDTKEHAMILSLQRTSIDVSMIPWETDVFINSIQQAIQDGEENHSKKNENNNQNQYQLTLERIKQSARRVVQLKYDLGLLDLYNDNKTLYEHYNGLDNTNHDDDRQNQNENDDEELDSIKRVSDLASMLDMVQDSIILTKNTDQIVPLQVRPPDTTNDQPYRILVTGPTSDSLSYQSGGWTGLWQGVPTQQEQGTEKDEQQQQQQQQQNYQDWFTYGTTIRTALELYAQQQSNENKNIVVTHTCGVNILGMDCNDSDDDDAANENQHHNDTLSSVVTNAASNILDSVKHWATEGSGDNSIWEASPSISRTLLAAQNVDVVIIGIGEESYTEKPGDIRSLDLPSGQYQLIQALYQQRLEKNYTTKFILVYLGGRPRLLRQIEPYVDAIFIAFLPGPQGGEAFTNLLFGQVSPNGRLPITYPMYDDGGGIPYYHTVSDLCTKDSDNNDGTTTTTTTPLPHYEYVLCPVQWPFGFGLSYTSFTYTNFMATGGIDQDIHVTVTVTNSGTTFLGQETVMFFTFDEYRQTTPEYKRLRAFEKVELKPGQSTTIQRIIPLDELRFIGPDDDQHYVIQPDQHTWIGVGGPDVDCRLVPPSHPDLCILLTSDQPDQMYNGACEAACQLWSDSSCGIQSFLNTNNNDAASACYQQCNTELWGWSYVYCLESVVWNIMELRRYRESKHRNVSTNNDPTTDTTDDECWMMTTFCRDIFHTPPDSSSYLSRDEYNEPMPWGMGMYSKSSSYHPYHNTNTKTESGFHGNSIILVTLFGSGFLFLFFLLKRRNERRRQRQQQQRHHQVNGNDNDDYDDNKEDNTVEGIQFSDIKATWLY